MRSLRKCLLLAGTFLVAMGVSGCFPNPFSMGPFTPVPVPPWVTERMQEKFQYRNDFRAPILGPIPAGYRPYCEDPPDRGAIVRAMPHVARGVPYIYEEHRDDLDFVVEKLADHLDPPRFFPLIGPAQLHHCHWKCTMYYSETIIAGYPFPFQMKRRRAEVVYMDRDHLHLVACTPEAQESISRDLTQIRP